MRLRFFVPLLCLRVFARRALRRHPSKGPSFLVRNRTPLRHAICRKIAADNSPRSISALGRLRNQPQSRLVLNFPPNYRKGLPYVPSRCSVWRASKPTTA